MDYREKIYVQLIEAYRSYAKFLGEALKCQASFLWAHGVTASQDDVTTGVAFRHTIQQLESEIAEMSGV